MTTATRNEAAERLHHALLDGTPDREGGILQTMLTEALAVERRATVERLRIKLIGIPVVIHGDSSISAIDVLDALNEEAER